jgi:hypothetical protein
MTGPAHRRAAQAAGQQAFIVFGGQADQPWLRLLRPGFRHCFAALADAAGWTVLDPLTGRLVVARLDLPQGFDLPAFYRRAGLTVLGPSCRPSPVRGCCRRSRPSPASRCAGRCWVRTRPSR